MEEIQSIRFSASLNAIRSLRMPLKIEIQHMKQIRKVVCEMYRTTRREARINGLHPKKMKTVGCPTNTFLDPNHSGSGNLLRF